MTRIVPSAAAAVLAVLLAVGALAGPFLLSASLLVAVVALATGWPNLLGLPTQRGSTTVLSLCGAGAVLLVSLDPGDAGLSWLAAGLAMSVVATFAHQLLRRDMRPRLVESVTGVVSGVVVVELVAGWVAAEPADPGARGDGRRGGGRRRGCARPALAAAGHGALRAGRRGDVRGAGRGDPGRRGRQLRRR